MKHSKDAYSSAELLYERARLHSQVSLAKSKELLVEFWIANKSPDRTALIAKAIGHAREAVIQAEEEVDKEALAKTFENLAMCYRHSLEVPRDFKSMKQLVEDMISAAEKAVENYRSIDDPTALLGCMELMTSGLIISQAHTHRGDVENTRRMHSLAREIKELSHNIGTPYARLLSLEVEGAIAVEVDGDYKKSLPFIKEGVPLAIESGDRILMGGVSAANLSMLFRMGISEEDPEKKRAFLETGITKGPETISYLEVPILSLPLDYARDVWAECHTMLAVLVETDVERRRELLKKATQIGKESLDSVVAPGVAGAKHSLGKALFFLSQTETDPAEKAHLLQESLKVRRESIEYVESLAGGESWDLGVQYNYLALVKSDQSSMEGDPGKKLELLRSALVDMSTCLRICTALFTSGQVPALAKFEEWSGDLHIQINDLQPDPSSLKMAIASYTKAVGHSNQLDHPTATAHLKWKIARTEDAANNYILAAREFRGAAEAFREASKKIPASYTTFNNTASYMDTWAFIEDARSHHADGDYILSAEDYQKAADALGGTKHWSFLTRQ